MNHDRLDIGDSSAVGQARRRAADLATDSGFGDTDVGRISLIVTEVATNLVKHAGGGEILLRAAKDTRGNTIDVLALDSGPGIADITAALRDGFSSAGSTGTGLGAIARTASLFECYSRAPGGTAVFARVSSAPGPAEPGLLVDGVNVAYPGEVVSGDTWAVQHRAGKATVLIADGLGHGPFAHEAASAAARAFDSEPSGSPAKALERIHAALRPTRGAAVAIAEVDAGRGIVRFAGLGNIAGTIVADGATRSVVSHHGTAGHDARRIQEFTYPWSAGARLVLHSDGLLTHWTLDTHPGLLAKHPALAAAVLYRDFRRGRDDTTVVVVKGAA